MKHEMTSEAVAQMDLWCRETKDSKLYKWTICYLKPLFITKNERSHLTSSLQNFVQSEPFSNQNQVLFKTNKTEQFNQTKCSTNHVKFTFLNLMTPF